MSRWTSSTSTPPFNSNASYNVLFKERTGEESPAQIKAFNDTWEWTRESERTFEQEIILNPDTPPKVKDMIAALREFLGRNAMMAYLVMMAPRLVELRRALKPTGSIYLHCDPTASHYLKLLMDAVFGASGFRSEIIWRRSNAHNKLSKQYGPIHDVLLFYTKTPYFTFHPGRRPYTSAYVERSFPYSDERGRYQSNVLTGMGVRSGESGSTWKGYNPTPHGRHWAIPSTMRQEVDPEQKAGSIQDILDAMDDNGLLLHPKATTGMPRYKQYLDSSHGLIHQDIWAFQPGTQGLLWNSKEAIDEDVKWLDNEAERLGYPTQKPLGLLERIIETSSDKGDVVLDPFCGCGTAVAAAQGLKRRWIGIDVTHLAVALMKNRLKSGFGLIPGKDYDVIGEPVDVGSARALAEQDRYQFEYWAMSLLEAFPREQGKKGADKGVDGVVYFIDGPRRTPHKAIVQVKSGKVSSPLIRDLKGTVEREKAAPRPLHHPRRADPRTCAPRPSAPASTTPTSGSATTPSCKSAPSASSSKATNSSYRCTHPCTKPLSASAPPKAASQASKKPSEGPHLRCTTLLHVLPASGRVLGNGLGMLDWYDLNARHEAILLWVALFLLFAFVKSPGAIQAFWNLLVTACQPVLIRVFSGHFAVAALFTAGAVCVGRPLGFWDTLPVVLAATWTSTSGAALLVEFDKALKERRFFVERAARILAPAFIVSELVSFSILSFWVEIVTLPFILLLGLMVQIADEREEYRKTVQLANTLLAIYVLALVSLTIMSLVNGSESWQSIIQHLALPAWLTLGALSHLHLLVVFERISLTFRSKSRKVDAREYGSAWAFDCQFSQALLCHGRHLGGGKRNEI